MPPKRRAPARAPRKNDSGLSMPKYTKKAPPPPQPPSQPPPKPPSDPKPKPFSKAEEQIIPDLLERAYIERLNRIHREESGKRKKKSKKRSPKRKSKKKGCKKVESIYTKLAMSL